MKVTNKSLDLVLVNYKLHCEIKAGSGCILLKPGETMYTPRDCAEIILE